MKDPNRSGTMTAERFIAKLRKRDATKGQRLHQALSDAEFRFYRRESAWRRDQLTEVLEAERPPAVAMAHALGLEIDAQPGQATPATVDPPPDPEPRTSTGTDGGEAMDPDSPRTEDPYVHVPERLRAPLSKDRLKVGQR